MGDTNQIAAQERLVTAVKNNDEKVLKQLYQESYAKIEVYILKNNGSKPQAKDTYQEAFIAVWQNVKKGKFVPENESALQGYLYRVARNKWTDFLRSSRYKKTSSLDTDFQLEDNSEEIDEGNDRKVSDTMAAFGRLGDECRQLLSQFYFEKRSLREIASVFKIGEASARNKKYRCINKLRELVTAPQ
ncbi:sigma-70 family RNA polymerase sigma factor [Aureitalea sp. L0-47]|uniref:RNA polymerase sigma factor n=1 Tax=Aureitalea sp. L0-47 TaxID=2816962 RepID=UPI0022382AAF|nr:sigma-70 family RNA polymerase sigma factor [Aureitalea sp. L0-47]MCW5518629.1 sigma-70 family RNA polymerase sigma factor [Aureitalea sp. L0-47]